MSKILSDQGIVCRADKVEDGGAGRCKKGHQCEPDDFAFVNGLLGARINKALLYKIKQGCSCPDLERWKDPLDDFADEERHQAKRMSLPE